MPRELHVTVDGKDRHDGSADAPFRTINRAAREAMAGDTITVHAGVYREEVAPATGGESDTKRITYRAAPDEHVVITGAERVTGWTHLAGSVWQAALPDELFGDFNPYREELSGDWFVPGDKIHHLGELWLDGVSLFEVDTLDEVMEPVPWERARDPDRALLAWHCEERESDVLITANFQGADPNEAEVEAAVRRACFLPARTGVSWITVRGFELRQAASPWAPPTAEQIGLIGPRWSKGWIIEDCHVHDAKCVGICLGKEGATGENRWTRERVKHGTQRERETIFAALGIGWSRDTVGSHVVRGCHVHDCEQAGIVGHLGCAFSVIEGNHIHDIHVKDRFTGHEMGGIKFHAAIDTLIRGNRIHRCTQGIWLDWQAQGTRVTGNLLYDNGWDDLFVEVNHGPYVVDHNVMLSPLAIKNGSQGGAFCHNLIGGRIQRFGVPNRFTPYHVPHSTAVAGLMTILGGDDRFLNNVFVAGAAATEIAKVQVDENPEAANAKDRRRNAFRTGVDGTIAYEGFPLEDDRWYEGRSPDHYAAHKLPVRIANNLYLNGAQPFEREEGAVVREDLSPAIRLEEDGDRVTLHLTVDACWAEVACEPVTTAVLGQAFQAETSFEEPDGTSLALVEDWFGRERSEDPTVGPFEGLAVGEHVLDLTQEA